MKKNHLREKILAVGIILLFVGTCIVPATAQDTKKPQSTSRGDWLYVGGDGPGNYTRIQDAINAASNGTTIYVYPGTYYGSASAVVSIFFKTIELWGADKNTTILDGSKGGYVIYLEHGPRNVSIHGFTIKNAQMVGIYGEMGRNLQVYDNIIEHNPIGARIRDSSVFNNIIKDNSIGVDNWDYAGTGFGYIFCNYFFNNSCGVDIEPFSWKVTVRQNIFQENDEGILAFRTNSLIEENNFINNTVQAISGKCFGMLLTRNHWKNNYWNHWKIDLPRPIKGRWFISLWILLQGFIPIFPAPPEFDWHPAQEPFDI